MNTWWKRGAAALFASAALTGGLVTVGSPAMAAKAMVPCPYMGEMYRHGSIIQDFNGNFMTCYNGNWIVG